MLIRVNIESQEEDYHDRTELKLIFKHQSDFNDASYHIMMILDMVEGEHKEDHDAE